MTAKEINRFGVLEGYRDGFANTSPVGSFKPNLLGVYDMWKCTRMVQ
ncbi:MAG: hypothetical protein IPK76_11825 [Lewinellaceae bacterium]|nr:hypothetical protein [Lewinellaceae bacterium]